MKTTYPIVRAAFGIAALVLIAILANWLISLTPAGNRGVDFTEHKIHSLSDGTRAILSELDTPVVIRYYASRNTPYMQEEVKLHMRRVDDLLKEYAAIAKGKLRIEHLDPEPDTDAEDSANLDGIRGMKIDKHNNLYFGLAVSCLENTQVVPFLDPKDETMLEYHLAKAISDVSTPAKPVIGIMSAFELAGSRGNPMTGQRGTPPWAFYRQLKQSFDLKNLGMTPASIDPKEIKVLLLFHPAGITPETEFVIDQYLLGGGTVIACLDAFSVAAQMTSGGGDPMMGGGGGTPTTSTLPTLLKAWGVTFESGQSLADPTYQTAMRTRNGAADGVAILTLPQEAMPQKDNVITNNLQSMMMLLPGGFTTTGGAGLASNSLARTSLKAGLVDPMRAAQLDPSLAATLVPKGTYYDLVTHLSGTFKTAFPDGKPGEKPAPKPEETKPKIGELPAEVKKEEPRPVWLKQAGSPGNVFLIADVDAFFDQFAYNTDLLQLGVDSPVNGNVALMLNLLDQASGSKHLIGSRSRAAVRRPFVKIKDMEDDFEKKLGDKDDAIKKRKADAEKKLGELQSKKAQASDPYLSPEQEAEIKNYEKELAEANRSARDMQKDLRRQKDRLTGNITLLNVAVMPVLVILFALGLFFTRRAFTRAR